MAHPGMELLFDRVKNELKSPSDVIVCYLHWDLVGCSYKCVGVGDTGVTVKKTELLPSGWNASQDVYILRYKSSSGDDHVFKVLQMDGMLLVHLMREKDEKIVTTNIRISDYTTGDLSSLDSSLKNEEKLRKQFRKDIIEALGGQKSSPKTGTSSKQRERPKPYDEDPLRAQPRRPQRGHPPEWADPDDPLAIGRGDLDPLGRAPGGMVFDPMRSGPRIRPDFDAGLPGRLPRGAVPPGARFDPFGPPGHGAGSGPDPDHMKPPGYDDMFM